MIMARSRFCGIVTISLGIAIFLKSPTIINASNSTLPDGREPKTLITEAILIDNTSTVSLNQQPALPESRSLPDTSSNASKSSAVASGSSVKPLDPYGDTVIMDDRPATTGRHPSNLDQQNGPSQRQQPYRPPLTLNREQPMAPLVDDGAGLETLVCPTVTQTVYLRPKTVTKTIHVIRPTGAAGQAQQAAQSLDYVTVASPNAGQPDLGRTVAPGVDSAASPAGAPAAGVQACGNSRQSTEFRNFVYISTQFVSTTFTEFATATRTVNMPVDVYREPVTRYKTVYVATAEAQPTVQYQRAASGTAADHGQQQQQQGYQEDLPVTVMAPTRTVTITQLQNCPSLTCDQSPPASFSAPLRGTAPALHRDRRPLPAAAAADQTSQSYTTSQEEENQAGLDAELPLQQPNLPRRTSSKIRPTPVIRRCRMLEANEDPDLLLPPNSDKNTVKMPVQEQPETTTITAENGDVYRWKRDSTAPAAVRSDLYRGDAHNYDYSIEQGAGDISGIQQPQVVEEIPLQEGTSPKTLESVEEIQPDVYSLQGRSGDRLRSDVSYEQPSAMRSAVRARGSPPASEPVPMATDFGSSDSSWYPC